MIGKAATAERVRRIHDEVEMRLSESSKQQLRSCEQLIQDNLRKDRYDSRAAMDAKVEAMQHTVDSLQTAHEAEQKRSAARHQHFERLVRQRDRAVEQSAKELEQKIKVPNHNHNNYFFCRFKYI